MISVVIVNFNAGALLADAVRRELASHLDHPIEVIVIDNDSTDDSLARLEAIGSGRLRLQRNDRNLGFATACNQGAKLAQGDHLLFLNPDCSVEPDTIAHALQALADHPQAAMAGALILNEDGSEQRGCRRNIPDPRRSLHRLTGLTRLFPKRFPDFNAVGTALPEAPTPVEAISGAFMLVRRDAFEAVGGWDEGYFLHCEDLDLCQRFRDHGYDILFVPAARAIHIQGTSSKGRPIRVEWHKHQGMWRFYRKFQAARNPAIFNGLVRLGIATHFVLKAARLLPRSIRIACAAPDTAVTRPGPDVT
jgi:GT2 family glycosyltransferase